MTPQERAAAVQAYQQAFTGSNRTSLSEAAFVAGYKAALAAAPAPQPIAMIEADDASRLADELEKLRHDHWTHWTAQENHIAAVAVRHLRLLAQHNASPSPQQDGPSDAEMLDWLEDWHTMPGREFAYGDHGLDLLARGSDGWDVDGEWMPGKSREERTFDTLREAIRAAMRETGGKTNG